MDSIFKVSLNFVSNAPSSGSDSVSYIMGEIFAKRILIFTIRSFASSMQSLKKMFLKYRFENISVIKIQISKNFNLLWYTWAFLYSRIKRYPYLSDVEQPVLDDPLFETFSNKCTNFSGSTSELV